MTRDEPMEWAKARAREYLDAGDRLNAWGSLVSDLGKHEETQGHPGVELGMGLLLLGDLATVEAMRRFIEGFN
jgi:hypothetical protein